jgi:hypothetical protein
MPVPCQADPHIGTDVVNDPALMAIRSMGVRHPGTIFQGRQRVLLHVRHHRQVHEVAGSKPCRQDQQATIVKFIELIICRFGVPDRIITDNGSQLAKRVFQEYCKDLSIQICYASMAHPESSGQVKRANAEIFRGLKTHTYDCLEKHGAKWIDEVPCELWASWTSPSWAIGETPFLLV